MGRRIEALVNPEMLVWARRRSHFDVIGAARRVGVKPERLQAWEEGKARPTVKQAMKLAQIYGCPLSAFYLRERPKGVQIAIQDFRQFAGAPEAKWSPALAREILTAQERRNVMLELSSDAEGEFFPPGPTRIEEDPETVAFRLRRFLRVSLVVQGQWRSVAQALRGWIRAVEKSNVLVFHTKVRGLALEPAEAHGFCLSYRQFPVIVLNAKDVVSRRIFTLLHEFVHLVLRQSGVCDLAETEPDLNSWGKNAEVFCNWVAGAILVPLAALQERAYHLSVGTRDVWDEREIRELASWFKVSREVVVRRLLTAGLTTREFYLEKREQYRREWEQYKDREKSREQKGHPPETVFVLRENGTAYCRKVFQAYYDDELTLTDLSDFLDAKLEHVIGVEKELFFSRVTP